MKRTRIAERLGIVTALRHRDFRLYWTGHVAAVTGQQMSMVIQAWLIFHLTGSALHLGLIGLARAAPALFLALAGGVAADKVDQRRLLIVTTIAIASVYGLLATVTLAGTVQVWHVLGAAFLSGALLAFEQPSRQSIFPHLIDRRDMMSAVGLNSTIYPGSRIFAPIVAGVLIDQIGVGVTGAAAGIYLVAGCYLTFSFLMFRVRLPHGIARAREGRPLKDLLDGMRYIVRHQLFSVLIGTSFVKAFFGGSHIVLLPIFVVLLVDEASGSALGLFHSALGVGGLLGAVTGGSLGSMRGRWVLLAGSAVAYGVILVFFTLAPWFLLAVLLEWAGALSQQLYNVMAQSTLHSRVPDEFRGRVMGVMGMQYSVVQPLGGFQLGLIASVIGAPLAVAMGGGLVALWALAVVARSREVRVLADPLVPASESTAHPSR